MAGIQPLPGGGNPWAQALPGFVQQLAMMKVRQNFIAKEAEMKREYDKVQLERQRIYQEEQLKKKQEFTSSENQKNRKVRVEVARNDRQSRASVAQENRQARANVAQANIRGRADVVQAQIKGRADLARELNRLNRTYGSKAPGSMTPNQDRLLEKDVASMAMTIEGNKSDPGIKQATVFFNKFNKGNSVYLWKKSTNWYGGSSGEAVRVDLPIIDGQQVTAADIRETMKQNKGKTFEDILKSIGAIE